MTAPAATLAVLLAAALLGLAGCSGDDESKETGAEKGTSGETTTTDRPPTTTEQAEAETGRAGQASPEAPRPEPGATAPPTGAGLPPKKQRDAAADGVCRTTETLGDRASPRLKRICDALREAARADTLAEYQRALGKAASR